MAHEVPVKIECRRCFGDGYWTHGYSKPMKVTCTLCEGRKHLALRCNTLATWSAKSLIFCDLFADS